MLHNSLLELPGLSSHEGESYGEGKSNLQQAENMWRGTFHIAIRCPSDMPSKELAFSTYGSLLHRAPNTSSTGGLQ